ncbi:hypothetical protein [Paenibacillus tianjinensis]|uniref:Uncharacterized protein n=1 Tax=Paenibacillus tianjinensis TaxID=2810347 RepID=A0ABX7L812_9BACL|nr:hypothetical protein [Paenibacillus tianjinensis]QSF43396.1 hypothetical protein JRJ22_19205 [Paenibacillus tianjinensis]
MTKITENIDKINSFLTDLEQVSNKHGIYINSKMTDSITLVDTKGNMIADEFFLEGQDYDCFAI